MSKQFNYNKVMEILQSLATQGVPDEVIESIRAWAQATEDKLRAKEAQNT